MRHRPVKNKEEIIEAGKCWLVEDPEGQKGRWSSIFSCPDHPLYLEIGSGKGKFIAEEAEKHPENNYLACEGGGKIYPRILQKIAEKELENLFVIPSYYLKERPCFSENELDGIYLSFSDPWPKDRHAKRRLTSRQFLARYEQVLAPGAEVVFKTDNQGLFDFSLEEAEAAGWAVTHVTRDLHADAEAVKDNVMTEYEQKFAAEGVPICRLIMHPEH